MRSTVLSWSLLLALGALPGFAQEPDPKAAISDPTKADADFAIQGEYLGVQGDKKLGANVIALGGGKFDLVVFVGGLPGEGWKKGDRMEKASGETKDGTVVFSHKDGTATLKAGVLTLTHTGSPDKLELKRVERTSPTADMKPPEGAVVLFDGTSADQFQGGKLDGVLLQQGVTSKQKFQNFTLHIEFRTPYQPYARGQGRGNSGCYLQGRYEVQMLDSFGLEGKDNECGGVYTIKAPDVNMCFPPLAWQTYDIDYTAAVYDGDKKVKNAKMTVKHNGVTVHSDLELPKATTAAPVKEGPEPGPIYLQDHGNPVRYRNIWILEKK